MRSFYAAPGYLSSERFLSSRGMMALPCLPGLLSLLVLCLYHETPVSGAAVQSVKAVGPSQPICAIVGGETILSCQLDPPRSAAEMQVFWETEHRVYLVHLYGNGTEYDDNLAEQYKGRTKMIKKDIANGGVGVSFTNITRSDARRYMCVFLSTTPDVETFAEFEIQVAGASASDLEKEKDNLQKEKDTLQKEKGDLIKARDNLQKEKDTLQKEKGDLSKARDNLQKEKDTLQKEKDTLQKEKDWRWARTFAAAVTLDPDTAHPWLILSEDGRSVRDGDRAQGRPDTPQRFNYVVIVLGGERLSSGRHYWEVEVGNKTDWVLGVCDEAVHRKGDILFTPKNGYWTVWLRDGEYKALTDPVTLLTPRVPPRAVGLFLDYEAGRLSVYNVDDRSLLFTYSGDSFPPTLRPFFSPGLNKGGVNAGALRILPVTGGGGVKRPSAAPVREVRG